MAKASILIVEDEEIVALDLANKLGQLGYEICATSATGEEAVALARERHPNLVLMDIRLPGSMDGVQTAEIIRRECDLPIVYLTAHSDRPTLQRAKLTEPYGYILKPFSEREIEAHIEMALYKHQAEQELRRHREWLQVTLQSIGDAVITTDAMGKVTSLNPVAEELTGWKMPEAQGRPLAEVFNIINEETRKPAPNPVERVLREGKVVGLANHTAIISRQGKEMAIEDSAAPIIDSHGRILGVVMVFHDVTVKRQAEAALRRSERRYRSFVDVTSQFDWVTDAAGKVVEDIPALRRFTGQTFEEAKGEGWADALHPEDVQRTLEVWNHATSTKTPYEIEYRMRRHDGVYRLLQARGVPILDEQGGVTEWVGACIDITERKRMETALRESESRAKVAQAVQAEWQRFYQVLNMMPAYLVLLSPDYRVPFANRFFEERFGKSNGRRCYEYLFNLTEPCENCETFKVLQTKAPHNWEWTGPDSRIYEVHDFPFTDVDGSQMIMEMGIDITEMRKAQAELKEANKVLEERSAKLQELVHELEHFSYTITHDMRAPLRMMQGFGQMMDEACAGCAEHDALGFLRRIRTSAARMDLLITDALNYSKSVRQELPLGLVDAGALLRGMLDSYPEFQPSKTQIRIEGDLPVVMANEAGLTQCFSNLLGNAVKFVKPGQVPDVRVWAEQRDGWAQIWLEDKGIGIPEPLLPRVFDMFSRGDRQYEGTGIGLALVRKVMDRMGGKVGVESVEGQGSKFWMKLQLPLITDKGDRKIQG